MRGPRERSGDFDAMIGTCRKAAERVEALAARYGAAMVRAAVAELMDRAEPRMRRAIGALPDGEYSLRGAPRERARAARAAHRARARDHRGRHASPSISPAPRPRRRRPPTSGPAMAPTGAFTIIKSFLDPGLRRELRRVPSAHGDHAAAAPSSTPTRPRRAAAWSR